MMQLSGSDLASHRGGREVFSSVGFAVRAGEALLVVGPNGAGKSALLRLIAGLVHVSRGRLALWLLDEPTSALDAAAQTALAGLMARHLAEGGLILAATHGPIGLQHAQELRLGIFSPSPHSPSKTGVNALSLGEDRGGGS